MKGWANYFMSIKKINNYYIVDYESELDLITDAKFGDKCRVIETATDYICNSQGKWFDTIPDSKQVGGDLPINPKKYATEEFVMNQIAGIEIPEVNLEGYATEEYVQQELSNIDIPEIDIPEIDLSNYLPKDVINAFYRPIKYEVTNLPKGSAVSYNDREIRIYCPEDVEYTHQQVSTNGDHNMYYMSFKAYAPEGAKYFKEGDRGVIIDEMFDFNASAAGTDKYGRNYSICWLALAKYDTTTGVWTYFGKTSTTEKYIGWNYVVEWYDANKKLIGADSIRINLSNKNCYLSPFPYYGAK